MCNKGPYEGLVWKWGRVVLTMWNQGLLMCAMYIRTRVHDSLSYSCRSAPSELRVYLHTYVPDAC